MRLATFTPFKPSTWLPTNKSGTVVWFRADSVTLSGSNVLSWQDRSGNGRDASAAASTYATLVSSDINGQPGVSFPGNDNTLYYNFGGTTQLFPIGSAGSIVVVTKSGGVPAGGFGTILSMICASAGKFATIFTSNQANYGLYTLAGGSVSGTNTNSSFNPGTAWSAMVQNYNGGGAFDQSANWTLYANNVLKTLTNGSGGVGTNAEVNSHIGAFAPSSSATLPYKGDIAEIIVWNSILSAGELTQLHTYLNNRYGVAVG